MNRSKTYSKYEDHVRVQDWRNVDMKNIGKRDLIAEAGYIAIAIILACMVALSWFTYRDNHPFADPKPVQQAQK